jgi:hypothetical protein
MKTKRLLLVVGTLALLQSASLLRAATTTPADALDATNLLWTTGGTGGVGWSYHGGNGAGNDTFDGIASAQSGRIGDNGETWLQTTVVGPGTVSFWWQAYSELNADWLEFYVNVTRQARICGGADDWSTWASGWEYCSFPVPAGTNVLKWRYVKDGSSTGATLDCAWVDRVSYVTAAPPPVQQALNTCGVAWSSAGNVYANGWFAQTNVTHDGKWAAQSGAIYHNQTNWLQASVSGVTNVSFWWKVSSEANGDYLQFCTNGVLAKQISGEVNWQSNYFKLPSKTNILAWRYVKNGGITGGADCGWLDQVAFSAAFKALPYALQVPAQLPDGRIQLQVAGEAGCPCRIDFSTNPMSGTNWSLLTNLTTTSVNTAIIDAAGSNSPMRYYRAVSR